MILVDKRKGSGELVPLFPAGVVTCTTLDFGDFMFFGNGPEDLPCPIGIERKCLLDLLNSMDTGRFSGHQLPGLCSTYQWVYLIVEGVWRYSPIDGVLETLVGHEWRPVSLGSRRFMANEITNFLNTIMVMAGIMVIFTASKRETVQVVQSLFRWWNNKKWEQHSSHLALNKSHQDVDRGVSLVKPGLVRRMASELPGIGSGKSRDVANHFSTVQEMMSADAREWSTIPGIGKTMAERIVEAIKCMK